MQLYDRKQFDLVNNDEHNFYKLVIDDYCPIDEFINELERNDVMNNKFNSIVSLMDKYRSYLLLPGTLFKHIKSNIANNIYEFKKKSLRVYVLKEDNDFTIILGGYKNDQKKDIGKTEKYIKEYLKSRTSL